MSKQQVQQNARDWAAEGEGLAALAQAATQGNSPRFRRELAECWHRSLVVPSQLIEGICQEADYVDNWLEREDYFGLHDMRTIEQPELG